jgi:predicted transcriptional regulator of viral defense system
MTESIEIQILDRIKKAGRGVLFFTDSFMAYGNAKAVSKALQRLVKAGEIERVAVGIYVRPVIDTVIGKVSTSVEDIARAIARRDRARIVPTGIYALNRLGLSTQVPLKVVFLTDGAARKIKIGNTSITFKKTAPKNVAAVGKISQLAIQALRSIGKEKVSADEIKKIQQVLGKEKKSKLEHDIRLAPAWIREIMKPVLNLMADE